LFVYVSDLLLVTSSVILILGYHLAIFESGALTSSFGSEKMANLYPAIRITEEVTGGRSETETNIVGREMLHSDDETLK
jgi:hypothetical protein